MIDPLETSGTSTVTAISAPAENIRCADSGHLPLAALDLTVVIVNWNARDALRDCIDSVFAHLGELSAEVIVVDNASADESATMVAREFPGATLIANDTNRGFAAANNQAMRLARGRYILLLNPDTVVLDDVLARSIEYTEAHRDIGVLGCQIMDGPDSIQPTCFRFPSPISVALWSSGLSAMLPRSSVAGFATYGRWDRLTERDVDVVSGMFMLVRREALEHVGLMDEDYFVYAEEADWCFRFWQAGWRCVFAPVGRIEHVEGGSLSTRQVSAKMYVEKQKNLLIFHKKRLGPVRWAASKLLFTSSMVLRSLAWVAIAMAGSETARAKAAQSAAAARFHLTGDEPH